MVGEAVVVDTDGVIYIVLQSETERCAHLRKTLNMLPAKHRDCLEFLMFHLARVASRERENLVSAPPPFFFGRCAPSVGRSVG